jgi:hypothetical protein
LWGWLFSGTGRVRATLPVNLCHSAVNVTVSLLATWVLGLPGPLLGTFVAYTTVSLWWVAVLLRRDFGIPLRPLALAVVKPVLLAVPYALGLVLIASLWPPSGWVALMIALGGSALGFLGLTWLFLFGSAERTVWRARVASVLALRRAA